MKPHKHKLKLQKVFYPFDTKLYVFECKRWYCNEVIIWDAERFWGRHQ